MRRIARDPLARGVAWSLAAHASLIAVLYVLLVIRQPDPVTVELDLALTPRLPSALTPAPKPKPRASKTWTTPKTGLAPAPVPAEEPVEEEPADPCPPPCPDRPGDFLPSALTSRPPKWVGGLIGEEDYPKVARRKGQDGRVMLRVFIDAAGKVRDVQLLEGSYPALNEAAIDKVREATFAPALDDAGRPVPCKLVLPIRFELR